MGIDALVLKADKANEANSQVIEQLAHRIGIIYVRPSAERMVHLDTGPYSSDKVLKARLYELVQTFSFRSHSD